MVVSELKHGSEIARASLQRNATVLATIVVAKQLDMARIRVIPWCAPSQGGVMGRQETVAPIFEDGYRWFVV